MTSVQSYAGTSSPYTFNGLVRHYFLRRQANLADLQVMLVEQGRAAGAEPRDREAYPHASRSGRRAAWVRAFKSSKCRRVRRCCRHWSPRSTGRTPSVVSSSHDTVRSTFERTPGVVDVDWYVESPQPKWQLDVDAEKAAAAGLVER